MYFSSPFPSANYAAIASGGSSWNVYASVTSQAANAVGVTASFSNVADNAYAGDTIVSVVVFR